MDCLARLIGERFLSAEAIERFRREIRRAAKQPNGSGKGLAELRKRVDTLSRQIDSGAEKVFAASPRLAKTLLAKLEQMETERDRLQAELDSLEAASLEQAPISDAEVDKALAALGELREVFSKADRKEVQSLLQAFIDRIEVDLDHGKRGKLTSNKFREGRIYLRPDAIPSQLMSTARHGGTSVEVHRCRLLKGDVISPAGPMHWSPT